MEQAELMNRLAQLRRELEAQQQLAVQEHEEVLQANLTMAHQALEIAELREQLIQEQEKGWWSRLREALSGQKLKGL